MRVRPIGHEELRAERLALALAVDNVFATPQFHETWWRHFGRGRELLLHAVEDDDGRLVGVLPLYRPARLPRTARFIGHGGGDALGPVARDGDRPEVASALAGLSLQLVLAEHVSPAWARALRGRPVLEERSPVLDLAGHADWESFLATRSSNFRQQVRGRARKLAKEHDVVFRLAEEQGLDADLDTLFRLHRARWPDGSEFAAHEAFHRDFARVGLEEGWTRLVVLELGGAPVGAWYGFRFGDADSYYQSGRDPGYERSSIGLVLLSHTIQTAFADGRSTYRFLRGDEPYKFRFTDDDARVVTVVTGPAAPLAAAGARGLRLSRGAARRLLRSLRRDPPPGAARPAD